MEFVLELVGTLALTVVAWWLMDGLLSTLSKPSSREPEKMCESWWKAHHR